MKTFDQLFEKVIKHEGYYANVPGDKGGETYMGIARKIHPGWQGWQVIDAYKFKHGAIGRDKKVDSPGLTQLVKDFYKKTFYNNYSIGDIGHGSLQEIIFDWCVNSGNWGSRGVQRVLNQFFDADLVMDGLIGKQTVSAINSCEPKGLFDAIKKARVKYYNEISKKGQNHLFLIGWLKRIGAIIFEEGG